MMRHPDGGHSLAMDSDGGDTEATVLDSYYEANQAHHVV